jgi:hypothetical protein
MSDVPSMQTLVLIVFGLCRAPSVFDSYSVGSGVRRPVRVVPVLNKVLNKGFLLNNEYSTCCSRSEQARMHLFSS